MVKFTAKEREKIVLEYENSNKWAKYFCEKYGFCKPNTLYKWVKKYKLFGINGLQEKRGRKYKIENSVEREQDENNINKLRIKLANERQKNKYLQARVELMEKSILSQYKKTKTKYWKV